MIQMEDLSSKNPVLRRIQDVILENANVTENRESGFEIPKCDRRWRL